MTIQVRKCGHGDFEALVASFNALRGDGAVLGSKYHKAVTSNATTGDSTDLTSLPLLVTGGVATSGAGLVTAAEMKVKLNLHFADDLAHKVADTADAITGSAPTTAATFIAMAERIQTAWNTHDSSTTYHYTADTNDDGTSITTVATALTSLGVVKTAYNLHVVSSPSGHGIDLIDP